MNTNDIYDECVQFNFGIIFSDALLYHTSNTGRRVSFSSTKEVQETCCVWQKQICFWRQGVCVLRLRMPLVFIRIGQRHTRARHHTVFLPQKENRSGIYHLTSHLTFLFRNTVAFIYIYQYDKLAAWYAAHCLFFVATQGIPWPLPVQISLQDCILHHSNPTDTR